MSLKILLPFIAIVAVLISVTRWGMDGIIYAVAIAGAVVWLAPKAGKRLKYAWQGMLSGKPSRLDHALAPSGYRRARRAESPAETAQQSVVRPTPNRPLIDSTVVDADPAAPTVALTRSIVPATTTALVAGQDRLLHLAANCNPPLHMVIGRAVAFFGVRGSGKTNALAVFLEQFFQWPIPALIGDLEEDYASFSTLDRCVIAGSPDWIGQSRFPRYWKVDAAHADQLGRAILDTGVRVVLQLSTFASLEEAAEVMTGAIKGMFAWAEERDPDNADDPRVPALIVLDEAQFFLPQGSNVSSIDPKQAKALLGAFQQVNSRGRKRGLTPVLAAQRPAALDINARAGTEIYFLGKVTNPRDLDAYDETVGHRIDRQHVTQACAGEFLVVEGGESTSIQFPGRKTRHKNITPGLTQALKRYGLSTRLDSRDFSAADAEIEAGESGEEEDLDLLHTELMSRPARISTRQHRQALIELAVGAILDGHTTQPAIVEYLNEQGFEVKLWDVRTKWPVIQQELVKQRALLEGA